MLHTVDMSRNIIAPSFCIRAWECSGKSEAFQEVTSYQLNSMYIFQTDARPCPVIILDAGYAMGHPVT